MPTKIEWATEVWNPITGCSPISEGCAHCYAERMAYRLKGRFGYPTDDPFQVTFHPDRLDPQKTKDHPLNWKKPRHIFVCSMGDLFHPDCFLDYIINDIYLTMAQAKQHTFLVLTKRPDNMFEWFDKYTKEVNPPLPNLWLGVTAENQQRADERIPILLQIPAAKRFVSIEPMLGAIDLSPYLPCSYCNNNGIVTTYVDWMQSSKDCPQCKGDSYLREHLDWVILGGESGPGARPMHPDWVRSVRDQCQDAGVNFWFKQWGEWCSFNQIPRAIEKAANLIRDPKVKAHTWGNETVFKIGKKAAGNLLDGRKWEERP